MTPLLVGVYHRYPKFMNAFARKNFVKKILPTIDSETLLLLEGGYDRSCASPYRFEYEKHFDTMEYLLGVPIVACPHIWFVDRRVAGNELNSTMRFRTPARRVVERCGIEAPSCTSFASLKRRIAGNVPTLRWRSDMSQYEIALARWYGKWFAKFDRTALRIAERESKRRRVIIICGALHALQLYRQTGWKLELLMADTKENANLLFERFYRSYHAHGALPPKQQRRRGRARR